MALFARSFRLRSVERNRQTDEDRRQRLCRAIEAEITAVQKEAEGLSRRVTEDYAAAVAMLDSGPDFAERTKAEETELRLLERSGGEAAARVAELDAQAGRLRELLEVAQGVFSVAK